MIHYIISHCAVLRKRVSVAATFGGDTVIESISTRHRTWRACLKLFGRKLEAFNAGWMQTTAPSLAQQPLGAEMLPRITAFIAPVVANAL